MKKIYKYLINELMRYYVNSRPSILNCMLGNPVDQDLLVQQSTFNRPDDELRHESFLLKALFKNDSEPKLPSPWKFVQYNKLKFGKELNFLFSSSARQIP